MVKYETVASIITLQICTILFEFYNVMFSLTHINLVPYWISLMHFVVLLAHKTHSYQHSLLPFFTQKYLTILHKGLGE